MPRLTLWSIFAVSVLSLACYERADRNPYGRWFSEILETIDRYYLEPVDDQQLFDRALAEVVDRLDGYSAFLPRQEAPRFEEELDQEFGGIGIEVSQEGPEKQLTVTYPHVGTPAFKAGILSGDQIVAIDGQSTQNLRLREIVPRLRGKPGTEVSLTVRRAGHDQPLEFHMARARIQTESIFGDLRQADGSWDFFLPGEGRIGYLRLTSFGKSTQSEFEAAMRWLTERNCRGVILDLRNNPGGLLESAEKICDQLIPADAVIVSTRQRDGREDRKAKASGQGLYQEIPLVVLINGQSASASEIVAACLQDHVRAVIVGERSWGKGTVQKLISVEGGRSLLKLTTSSYWRPSGKNIHRLKSSRETDEWGVMPDAGYEVKLDQSQFEQLLQQRRRRDVASPPASAAADSAAGQPAADSPLAFDPQLARALQALEEKLSAKSKPGS